MNFLEIASRCPGRALGKTCFDSDQQPYDMRLPLLLVLLEQLDEHVHRLEGLPEFELSEIVSAAVRVCGFVEPMEALQAISTVLQELEMRDPVPGRTQFRAEDMLPS
ncbi:MAG: hypothetical protein ACYDDS_09820 [Candidatus Sulfotelmatobacter sp.]|jgi:hypothetical protein